MAAVFFDDIHSKILEQLHACNWNATDEDSDEDSAEAVVITSEPGVELRAGSGLVGFGALAATLIRCHCIDGDGNRANDVVLAARDNLGSELYVSRRHAVFFLLCFHGDDAKSAQQRSDSAGYEWARAWLALLGGDVRLFALCSLPQHLFPNMTAPETLRYVQHQRGEPLVPPATKGLLPLEPGYLVDGAAAALLSRCRRQDVAAALVVAVHPPGCADIVHVKNMRRVLPLLRRTTAERRYPLATPQLAYAAYLTDERLFLSGDLYQ